MKYCSKCGKELPDEAKFCTDCGEQCDKNEEYAKSRNAGYANVSGNEFYSGNANGYNVGGNMSGNNGYNGAYNYGSSDGYGQNANLANNPGYKSSGLKTAAKVFMIISCAICGVLFLANIYLGIVAALSCLVPLCWQIPMTIVYFEKLKNGERIGTGFKVCSLLFVSLVAGILMLCDND